jgi:mannose/fructose-specific phosphotransferase system component IIA
MSEGIQGPVRGVLIAHGTMAHGIADAVRKISGQGEDALLPLSNDGRSPERLRQELERLLGDEPAVVFTDLQGGSCAVAALGTARSAGTLVICGANLPMLLDFVFHRDLTLEALSERLVAKGREGIRGHHRTGVRAELSTGARGAGGD